MVADFRKRFQQPTFHILCASYWDTLQGEDISHIAWTDWPRVIESVRNCDCLIVGGGGLFNCYLPYAGSDFLRSSSNFAAFIFGLPILAFLLGKRCCIYAVGASRFFSDEALAHAQMAVRMSELCTVRDRGSRRILSSGMLQRQRIRVHADPAFRIVNAPAPETLLEQGGFQWEGRPAVAVVLRNWSFDGKQVCWEDAVAEALRCFVERFDVRLLFIPFQASTDIEGELSNDPALISRIRARIAPKYTAVLEAGLPASVISGIIAKCEMVVGMRLHASILAVRNGIPVVSIAYEPKVARVMAECGLERFVVPLPEDGPEALCGLLEAAWTERDQIRIQLRSIATRMEHDAGKHVEDVAALMEKKRKQKVKPADMQQLIRVVGEQTERLAIAEAALVQAEAERNSFLQGLRELVNNGEYASSLQLLQRWKPGSFALRAEREYLLGFCLHSLGGDPTAALEHYHAALAGGFDEFWVRLHRAQLWFGLGSQEQALADLRRACSLRPNQEAAAQLLKEWTDRLPAS